MHHLQRVSGEVRSFGLSALPSPSAEWKELPRTLRRAGPSPLMFSWLSEFFMRGRGSLPRRLRDRCCAKSTDVLALVMRFCVQLLLLKRGATTPSSSKPRRNKKQLHLITGMNVNHKKSCGVQYGARLSSSRTKSISVAENGAHGSTHFPSKPWCKFCQMGDGRSVIGPTCLKIESESEVWCCWIMCF